MEKNINYRELRQDLMDYFGTAVASGNPMAIIELSKVETATDQQLLQIAIKNGFDLTEYIESLKKR